MKTGIVSKEILLPKNVDMEKWSVIACDQYTGQKDYWVELKEKIGNAPSTLNMVLPEIYLSDNAESRINKINGNIHEFLMGGGFKALQKGFVLVVRSTPFVERRIGLIGAVDLEDYNYKKGEKPLIRATEGTIEERIPPRLKIREHAEVEFPHIMVLFDDEKRQITEPLYENRNKFEKLYDFDLNMNGGHIEGYFIPESENLIEKFSELLDSERLISKYGKEDKFAFAVGDGNHSLATAKAHWENVKKGLTLNEQENHPARFALCEFVNIYDEGIYFEPIYRVVYGVNRNKFIGEFVNANCGKLSIYNGKEYVDYVNNVDLPITISNTDAFIKNYIENNGGSVDYIHGKDSLEEIVNGDKETVGILFDKMNKSDLFAFVSKNGALPRKTFSMGESVEKRYYLEGSKIVKWLKYVNSAEHQWLMPRQWTK